MVMEYLTQVTDVLITLIQDVLKKGDTSNNNNNTTTATQQLLLLWTGNQTR